MALHPLQSWPRQVQELSRSRQPGSVCIAELERPCWCSVVLNLSVTSRVDRRHRIHAMVLSWTTATHPLARPVLFNSPMSDVSLREDKDAVLSSFWTAARGDEVINCELIVPGHGHPTLRCAFGPRSVIRSQFIASADAAAEVAESWKTALVAQGFRIVSASPKSC